MFVEVGISKRVHMSQKAILYLVFRGGGEGSENGRAPPSLVEAESSAESQRITENIDIAATSITIRVATAFSVHLDLKPPQLAKFMCVFYNALPLGPALCF